MYANTKITEISLLSDKDVKVTISKMFQQAIMNTFETNGKQKAPGKKISANKQKI